jgi:hypothetical protein
MVSDTGISAMKGRKLPTVSSEALLDQAFIIAVEVIK